MGENCILNLYSRNFCFPQDIHYIYSSLVDQTLLGLFCRAFSPSLLQHFHISSLLPSLNLHPFHLCQPFPFLPQVLSPFPSHCLFPLHIPSLFILLLPSFLRLSAFDAAAWKSVHIINLPISQSANRTLSLLCIYCRLSFPLPRFAFHRLTHTLFSFFHFPLTSLS